uniref:Uncharacterized protein n=1 Tax=Setaria viridis TaxID=4556 RepID=A0A4U6W940_SETVI|nr:hypothetical protein SEVIR_1G161100v2 [Setaria viridis]
MRLFSCSWPVASGRLRTMLGAVRLDSTLANLENSSSRSSACRISTEPRACCSWLFQKLPIYFALQRSLCLSTLPFLCLSEKKDLVAFLWLMTRNDSSEQGPRIPCLSFSSAKSAGQSTNPVLRLKLNHHHHSSRSDTLLLFLCVGAQIRFLLPHSISVRSVV